MLLYMRDELGGLKAEEMKSGDMIGYSQCQISALRLFSSSLRLASSVERERDTIPPPPYASAASNASRLLPNQFEPV